jgi:hypothetical protein
MLITNNIITYIYKLHIKYKSYNMACLSRFCEDNRSLYYVNVTISVLYLKS